MNSKLIAEPVSLEELENVKGGVTINYKGCAIANGQCADGGCGICNGKCGLKEDFRKGDKDNPKEDPDIIPNG